MGYDSDMEKSHSGLGRVGREKFTLKPVPKPFEWMIRVKLADRPVYYDAADPVQ